MKERLYILREFLHFIFIAIPVFVMVITMVYVGFFFYDCYNLIKKLWKRFSKH